VAICFDPRKKTLRDQLHLSLMWKNQDIAIKYFSIEKQLNFPLKKFAACSLLNNYFGEEAKKKGLKRWE